MSTYKKRPAYKKSIETRDKILKTAVRLFAEKGYIDTTIREICSESGLSSSRVNYHFNGKNALAEEKIQLDFKWADRKIREQIDHRNFAPMLYTLTYIRLWMNMFISNDAYVRFYSDLFQEGILTKAIYEPFYQHFKYFNQVQEVKMAEDSIHSNTAIFVASFGVFIKWKHANFVKQTNEQFLDIFSELFLKLFNITRENQHLLIDQVKQICASIHIESEQ